MSVSHQSELNQLITQERIHQQSSEEDQKTQVISQKKVSRKPIKNPFSDDGDSDSDFDPSKTNMTPFPPKAPKEPSVLEKAKEVIKWDREEEKETEVLMKLQGQGMKEKKIRELASKFKSLNLAYERERTLRKSLQDQLNAIMRSQNERRKSSLEKEHPESLNKPKQFTNYCRVQSEKGRESASKSKPEGKCKNCQQNEKKVMEMRVKSQSLKNQLNKAQRLITKEIGDITIDQALAEESSWKGRQQKINKLNTKIKQLQEKLQSNGVSISQMTGFTQLSKNTVNSTTGQRSSALVDNKRKQLENLKVQCEALKSENQLLQAKVKAVNSRKFTLENELKEAKSEFQKKKQIYLQKSENDDQFIKLLKIQVQKLKKEEKIITKVIYKESKENSGYGNKEMPKNYQQEEKKPIQNDFSLKRREQPKKQINAKPLIQNLEPKIEKNNQNQQKALNIRQVSAEKKKQVEEEYLKGQKYLRKITAEQEQNIYSAWKQSKKQ